MAPNLLRLLCGGCLAGFFLLLSFLQLSFTFCVTVALVLRLEVEPVTSGLLFRAAGHRAGCDAEVLSAEFRSSLRANPFWF